VPHLGSRAAHRRATSITGISGMAAVGGALRLPAKFPNSNRPTPRVPERRDTGQKTAQRTSTATPADISGSHVTIATRSSLGSAGASRTSRIRMKPGGTFVCARRTARQLPGGRLDCQRDLSKNLAGPSGTEQGTGIASKGVGLDGDASLSPQGRTLCESTAQQAIPRQRVGKQAEAAITSVPKPRSQRKPSQRVEEPKRGAPAAGGTRTRRYRSQPSHTPAVLIPRE